MTYYSTSMQCVYITQTGHFLTDNSNHLAFSKAINITVIFTLWPASLTLRMTSVMGNIIRQALHLHMQ